ncbi:hypothetical protein [Enhygromyxa salina]|uniref:Uncharacterized protein n=1 Tax=Enhygromyxa salina TaxID=215803 RepID=A0A2S9YMG4_9BACT|nr:hypothetical protein [Enhygromyxa salina]PRQ06246.1 hypothetical protein ENSA7_40940 [Enhygromyxa salina]
MSHVTLRLTRCTLLAHKPTKLLGWGVISAVAYDGKDGIRPVAAIPAIKFARKLKTKRVDFLHTTPGAGGDGLLIASFDAPPKALGWVATLTLTDTAKQAAKVISAVSEAAGTIVSGVPGSGQLAGTLFKAAGGLAMAIGDIVGARVVGTCVGSEIDDEDLSRDWDAAFTNFKTRFEISYDIEGAPST